MTGEPGTAATAIKEGGRTQPLIFSSSFVSSLKTESNKLLDVLDRIFRSLFLVGSLAVVFTGALVVLVFESLTRRLFELITGAFAFFTGDLLSFTFTAELLSLALATFHLALLLVFLCEVRVGSLELEELVVKEVVSLLFELELVPVEDSCR